MERYFLLLVSLLCLMASATSLAADYQPHYPELANGGEQYSAFPIPAEKYPPVEGGLMETLKSRAKTDPFNVAASIIFALAILHTFAAGFFIKLAHKYEHLHDEALKQLGVRDAEHLDRFSEYVANRTALEVRSHGASPQTMSRRLPP